jgi:hypothetical protein
VGKSETTVRNIIKHAREIKGKGKVASTFCVLQTSTRYRSVIMTAIGRLVTVWTEDCNQKRIPLSRAATHTKALHLYKRAKEIITK